MAKPPCAAVLMTAALLFVAGTVEARAQTADRIITRNLAARGIDRWKTVKTLRLTGTITSAGRTVPVIVLRQRPNLIRQETAFEGGTIVAAFDGRRAWTINPFAGASAPQQGTVAEARRAREQADFDGVLVNYWLKGHTVELGGTEQVNGRPARRLTVRTRSGQVLDLLIDAETALEVKTIARETRDGGSVTVETEFGDYRKVRGVMVPHRVRSLVDGQVSSEMIVDKVELNVPIDPRVFRMPTR